MMLGHLEGGQSRAAAPSHQKEPVEVVWASDKGVSWVPAFGGLQGMSNWEEILGQTQSSVEGLHILSGPGTPWDPPGGAGKRCHRGTSGPSCLACCHLSLTLNEQEIMDLWILLFH